jgi:hypothetical protein
VDHVQPVLAGLPAHHRGRAQTVRRGAPVDPPIRANPYSRSIERGGS